MKLSLRWAQQFTTTDLFKDVNQTIQKIGSQLGAVDEVIDYSVRYDDILVVKIVKCQPHPDADKLKICWIDDGKIADGVERDADGLVQVVCGGPNARADIFTAWIRPKTVVPSSWDKDKFTISAREIRGKISYGMLASPSELAISDEHEGIIEITEQDIGKPPAVGESIKKLYGLDDIVIDIENKMFTHRPDLFGTLGLSRELTAIFGDQFISPQWYKDVSDIDLKPSVSDQLELNVQNMAGEAVSRFTAIALSDVKVEPSPYWLQAILTKVGVKPINNIVDVTNFVMYLTGQPLHAFDYDKVKAKGKAGLESRLAVDGESLKLLNGKTINLSNDNIVIANPGGEPMALAGVMGGVETEVDESTTKIIFECATFDMYTIRKTAMQFGLFTDAVTRYTKGQSPRQNLSALSQAVALATKLSGGKVASSLVDLNQNAYANPKVEVSTEFINSRLGLRLEHDAVVSTLSAVEFDVQNNKGNLIITAPFWRTDIHIAEDIVEEVGRLIGYDKLPKNLPARDLSPNQINHNVEFKYDLRQLLVSIGANELLTYSFVNTKLIESAGQDANISFKIRNALSPDLQNYRLSLTPSLLEKVHPNAKLGYKQLTLFELGNIYIKDELVDDVPKEHQRLSLVSVKTSNQPAYFTVKNILLAILDKLNIENVDFEPLENCSRSLSPAWSQVSRSFESKRSAVVLVDSEIIGLVGEPIIKLKKALKLPNYSACFELDTELLNKRSKQIKYNPVNRYPSSTQDITYKVSVDQNYKLIYQHTKQQLEQSGYNFRLNPVDIYAKPEDPAHINYSFRIELWHPEKTLVTEEFNRVLDAVAKSTKEHLHAERV